MVFWVSYFYKTVNFKISCVKFYVCKQLADIKTKMMGFMLQTLKRNPKDFRALVGIICEKNS